jgi:class 3 adenylate cyclase
MNQQNLQQKLATLASMNVVDAAELERFGQILGALQNWDLHWINPIDFAKKYNFSPEEMIHLFIHGAKIGLFDFSWNIICPTCGCIERSISSLNGVENDKFHCNICYVDVPTTLDDQVEVAFTINPGVAQLLLDPFSDVGSYHRYFFSANFQRSPEMYALIRETRLDFTLVDGDASHALEFEAEAGKTYRLISIDRHIAIFFHTMDVPAATPQIVPIDIVAGGFSQTEVNLAPGKIILNVSNRQQSRIGLVLLLADFERMHDVLNRYPPYMKPFLTGKDLLNNQSFRDLFRMQELNADLRLNIRSLTVLFTDLKGSTELYDITGDTFAYGLIQEHFKALTEAARKNSGAVIKTMGDAVMATFSSPQEGVQAALDMMTNIGHMNGRCQRDEHILGLKIGLHEGTALAVNTDDRLDYFGQTINIAARIQGLAAAAEIWLTEPVFTAAGVPDMLQDYANEKHHIHLKGVRGATTVYRCHR